MQWRFKDFKDLLLGVEMPPLPEPLPTTLSPLISVVVPTRPNESVDLTLSSLMKQTCQDFEVHVVVDKDRRGAPWARNRGAEVARGRYLLFSDADITWHPDALALMVEHLEKYPLPVGYAYGGYRVIKPTAKQGYHGPFCMERWRLDILGTRNFVSTMSLMRREVFKGWDESLQRLQDWALWLEMARRGIQGVWVGREIFSTPYREGITFGGSMTDDQAREAVRLKYGLPRSILRRKRV